MPKTSSSRLRFTNKDEARDLRKKQKQAAKAQRRADKAQEFIRLTTESSAPSTASFYAHDSSDEGGVPWHRARKSSPGEFVSLWDDVDEDEMLYDSRQASWARSSAEQAEEDAVFESYDAWASRIAAEMRRKSGRHREDDKDKERRKSAKQKEIETETAASFLHEEALRKQKLLQRDRLAYRKGWSALSNAKDAGKLGVKDVPAPVANGQCVARDSVSHFFFAACDFSVEEKRKMLRDSLLLWHPDKFARRKPLFAENEWDSVVLLVNSVSQALNAIYSDI
ncbi:hypothetical protein HDU86_007237 [Geranomyces michiganensis]|nr:hypothetical protein HDU86_007237 [Geranomyces michiganensis]